MGENLISNMPSFQVLCKKKEEKMKQKPLNQSNINTVSDKPFVPSDLFSSYQFAPFSYKCAESHIANGRIFFRV